MKQRSPVGTMLYARSVESSTYELWRQTSDMDFKNQSEIDSAIKRLLVNGKLKVVPPRNQEEEAQLLMYRAFEGKTKAKRIFMARKALNIFPDCTDACVLLAAEDSADFRDAEMMYRRGVESWRRVLGEEFIRDNMGDLWGYVRARPLLRAMNGLAIDLWELKRYNESNHVMLDIIAHNRNDNMGVRLVLMRNFILLNKPKEALKLFEIKEFMEDTRPDWIFGKALARFGDEGFTPKANSELEYASKKYPLFVQCMVDPDSMVDPAPGSDDYLSMPNVFQAVDFLVDAWELVPGAMEWLEGRKSAQVVTPYHRPEAKTGRNTPCPCGSGKKYKHCCGKADLGSIC